MRLFLRYSCLPLSVLFITASIHASAFQSDRPSDGFWRCFTAPDKDPIYFTGVWEQRVHATEVRDAFAKFLAGKYGYTGRVSCNAPTKGSSDLAKATAESEELQRHYQKAGMKVIATGWTHLQSAATGTLAGKPAPPPGVAPAPVAPTHWGACKIDRYAPGATAQGPFNTYISDVFPFDPKVLDLVKTFDAFIDAKYGTDRDNPNCNIRTSEDGVRAMHKTWIDEANKNGKAILTGWTYPGK